ncbi:hypothetical protein [Streptomyces sp. NPDC005407]|uniref:hypothetical protein n=1 Tax=Streptomyces sp. NPDC005407 TaxID=3155340 RepID=UPI0033BA1619
MPATAVHRARATTPMQSGLQRLRKVTGRDPVTGSFEGRLDLGPLTHQRVPLLQEGVSGDASDASGQPDHHGTDPGHGIGLYRQVAGIEHDDLRCGA